MTTSTTTVPAAVDQGTAKLMQLFQPSFARIEALIQEQCKLIDERNVQRTQEIMLKLEGLETRLITLEQGVAGTKKKITQEKAATGATTGDAAGTRVDPADKFPTSKLFWFRQQYKLSADFRKTYLTEPVQAVIQASDTLQSKLKLNKPEQYYTSESVVVWNYHKKNTTGFDKDIEVLYKAAAEAHKNRCQAPPTKEVPSDHSDNE